MQQLASSPLLHVAAAEFFKTKLDLLAYLLGRFIVHNPFQHCVDLAGCEAEAVAGPSKGWKEEKGNSATTCVIQGESPLLASSPSGFIQKQQDTQDTWLPRSLNMVAHVAAVLFCAYIIYIAVPGTDLFSWHPTLMVLAYAAAMFEAVLVFSPHSSLVGSLSRQTKVTLHWSLASLSALLAVGGLAVIFQVKENKQKEHFTTWHGLLGLITVGYSLMQLLGGASVKYYSFSSRFIKMRLADLKMTHAVSGVAAFTLVSTSLTLALYSNWVSERVQGAAWYACSMAVGWMALVVMNQVTTAYAPRFKPRRGK